MVWTADFKGQFRTRDGVYRYPLTVVDGCSRYLLACRGLPSVETTGARGVFERLFREYGQPARIRSDNGVPFATIALARLSTLSVWWLRLGLLPDLTEPSAPPPNGRHGSRSRERMHRTLKAEATRPAAAAMAAQQRVFDRFRREYNTERPHEALGQATPASRYAPSARPSPRRLPPVAYPAHWEVRRVSRNGGVRWYDARANVSHGLAEEYVGMEEVAEGLWQVYFGPLRIGRFHERTLKTTDANGYTSRNPRQVSPISRERPVTCHPGRTRDDGGGGAYVRRNVSGSTPMSRQICRRSGGARSRPAWNGTVVCRPSGCRNCLCEPRWRTSTKPRRSNRVTTSRGLRTGSVPMRHAQATRSVCVPTNSASSGGSPSSRSMATTSSRFACSSSRVAP